MLANIVSLVLAIELLAAARDRAACPGCEAGLQARAQMLDSDVLSWLALASLPFVLLAVLVTVVWRRAPLAAAGLMLGAGLGALVDGIVLHQLLQWNDLLSSVRPPVDLVTAKLNTIGDGVFHALAWAATAAGVVLLWRATTRRMALFGARMLVASLAAGWGAFAVLEGVIDHQLLGIHHVRAGAGVELWDAAFLAFGAALCVTGYLVVRREPSARALTMPAPAPG